MNHTFWTLSNNAHANWDHFVQNVMAVLGMPVSANSSALVFALALAVLVLVVANGISTILRAERGVGELEKTARALRWRREEMARAEKEGGIL